MSDLASSARVVILVADYVTIAEMNKATIVGAGITIMNRDPATGRTAPVSVLASVSFDPKFIGEVPTVDLALETKGGVAFEVQQQGQDPLPLRVSAEPAVLMPTEVEGIEMPRDVVRPRIQLLLQFPSGLPLQVGEEYVWRVTIDGETRDEWTESLYVFGPKAQS